jgi:hypothetical protein
MAPVDWTRDEVEAAVADYFVMLGAELRRFPYSKVEHNRRLQALIGWSKRSIEFKHQRYAGPRRTRTSTVSAHQSRLVAAVSLRAEAPPQGAERYRVVECAVGLGLQ